MKVAQSCLTLCRPMDSPGQNTGMGSLSLLQGIFPTQGSNPGLPHCRRILYQLSHQGSPRILGWAAYPFSWGSFRPRNRTGVSCIAGGFFTNWAIREVRLALKRVNNIIYYASTIQKTKILASGPITSWQIDGETVETVTDFIFTSAPALSTLSHALNLDWLSVSHMIIYMFQCYSLKSSHSCLLPHSPKVCSLYLCLFWCLAYRVIITIFLNSIYMC